MNYKITRNDRRFECVTKDLTPLPEWGKPAWTETIPAWTQTGVWSIDEPPVFDPGAIIEHPEQIIEHPAEYTVEVIDLAPQEQEAARAAAIAAVQARLDTLAQSWGWDSIQTLMNADRSSVARFRAEGVAGRALYDATWWAVDQHQDAQSWDELLSYLPPLPARPAG